MKKTNFVKEHYQEIVDLYRSGIGGRELAKIYNMGRIQMFKVLKTMGFQPRKREDNKTYTIDDTFFESVDTAEKAYVLGFLYADGYNAQYRNSILLRLCDKDEEIMIKIRDLIKSNRPFRKEKTKSPKGKICNSLRMEINNKKMSQDLACLGCPQGKTFILKFPHFIHSDLIRHWVRGLFDGDGCVHICKKDGQAKAYFIGTLDICENIKKILQNNNIRSRMRPVNKTTKGIFCLIMDGNCQLYRFYHWIYQDSTIELSRKRKVFHDHFEVWIKKINKTRIKEKESVMAEFKTIHP